MAISHVLSQIDGNEVRSAMSLVDFDGADSNGIGSTLGMTVASDLNGTEVDASTAELYTSVAVLNNHDMVAEACAALTAAMSGVDVRFSENAFDKFVIHFEGINAVANNVLIGTPVLTVV